MVIDLLAFPPEILLHVVSFLRIPDIHRVVLLSRSWKRFLDTNASAVYRSAAILHQFVHKSDTPDGPHLVRTLQEEAAVHPGGWLSDVDSWKAICQRWYRLERNWFGEDKVSTGSLTTMGRDVHRVKVDEAQRVVICSHHSGGLTVSDLRDGQRVLWSLPPEYARRYAHVEFTEGFLIFDRSKPDHTLEVWRRAADYDVSALPDPHPAPPIPAQLRQSDASEYQYARARRASASVSGIASPNASLSQADLDSNSTESGRSTPQSFTSATTLSSHTFFSDKRGVFKPWALLRTPCALRAYRAVNGELLVGSEAGQEVYVFDLRAARLVQRIPLRRAFPQEIPRGLEDVGGEHIPPREFTYVELGARHAFVCTTKDLLILSREFEEADQPSCENTSQSRVANGGRGPYRSVGGAVFPSPEMHLTSHMMAKQLAIKLGGDEDRDAETFVELDIGDTLAVERDETAPTPVEIRMPPTVTAHMGALLPLGEGEGHSFIAAHVSEDGRDFAALTYYGVLFLVRGFERALRGEAAWEDITASIYLGDHADNLCFEHGRVVVQTSMGSIYAITLDATAHSLAPPLPALPIHAFPYLRIHRLTKPRLWNVQARVRAHCLQATQTAVYMSWNRRGFAGGMGMQEAIGAWVTLSYMDLTPSAAGRIGAPPPPRQVGADEEEEDREDTDDEDDD